MRVLEHLSRVLLAALPATAVFLIACAIGSSSQAADEAGSPGETEPAMVLVPGGEFIMGEEGFGDSSPPHRVRLDSFYLDKFEVTNAQYLEFCEETDHRLPEFWGIDEFRSGPEYPGHPVVGVSWHDARAYAKWRGARLPTEAEWEYAARGGLEGTEYSHGEEFDPALYAETGVTGTSGPSPVGMFPANGFNLHDMTGNVTEWVRDWYDQDYYQVSPAANPPGPGHGRFRLIRGGGWHTGPYCSRVCFRNALPGNWVDINVGFRCARYMGESAARVMERTIEDAGIDSALAAYDEMRIAEAGEFYFDEAELNDLGYGLLRKEQVREAVEILRLNAEAHPHSYNAYDSLGEAYLALGDREQARRYYRRSLELNPACRTSREALRELEEE